jgi:hypothetical protein
MAGPYLENSNPEVRQARGINTQLGITMSGSGTFDASASTGSFKFPSGSAIGYVPNVISGVGATYTLTAAQSGSICLFDRAAGNFYTLPQPVVGLSFQFIQTVSVTSNASKFTTATTASQFLIGEIQMIIDGSATTKAFSANGSSMFDYTTNGSTTGGLIGTSVECICISSTLWLVSGLVVGSGTLATPFSAS